MKLSICLFLFSIQAFAVCIPTNHFHKKFLGFSPDGSEYAVGHFDQVHMYGPDPKVESQKSQFCRYKTADNNIVECTVLDFKINGHLEFNRDVKKYFKKNFKNWEEAKENHSQKIDSTLDCRGAAWEGPAKCVIEISEEVGELDRKFLLKKFHQVSAHSDPSRMLRTDSDRFVSTDQKSFCFKYQLRHESANCGSFEQPIYCIRI